MAECIHKGHAEDIVYYLGINLPFPCYVLNSILNIEYSGVLDTRTSLVSAGLSDLDLGREETLESGQRVRKKLRICRVLLAETWRWYIIII